MPGKSVRKEWRPMTKEDWHNLREGDALRLGPKTIAPGLELIAKQCHSAPWTLGAYRADGTKPKQFYSLSHWAPYEVRA